MRMRIGVGSLLSLAQRAEPAGAADGSCELNEQKLPPASSSSRLVSKSSTGVAVFAIIAQIHSASIRMRRSKMFKTRRKSTLEPPLPCSTCCSAKWHSSGARLEFELRDSLRVPVAP